MNEFATAGLHEELLALDGDSGARSLLARRPHQLDLFACDDLGTVRDVDTLADLLAPAVAPADAGAQTFVQRFRSGRFFSSMAIRMRPYVTSRIR